MDNDNRLIMTDIKNGDLMCGVLLFKNNNIENEFIKLSKYSMNEFFYDFNEMNLMVRNNQKQGYSHKVFMAFRTKEKLFKVIIYICHNNNKINAVLNSFELTDRNGYIDFIDEIKKMHIIEKAKKRTEIN